MLPLPVQIQEIMAAFAPLFTRPVWHHAQVLIVGVILARGKRTVTSALRAIGFAQERHFTNDHRVLNRAVWHASFTAKVLLGRMVALLPPGVPLQILVDETMERRKGDKIKTKGVFRDAVRSSRKKVVHCYGLRWVAMMLLVPVPWSRRPWALPFFTVQAPSEKTCRKLGKPPTRASSIVSALGFGSCSVVQWSNPGGPVLFRHQPLVHAGKASRPYPVGRGARPRGRARRHPSALHRPDRHRYSNHRVVRATMEHRSHIRGVASSPWRRNPTAMVRPSHRPHYPLSLRSVFSRDPHGHPSQRTKAASRCANGLVPKGASNLLRRHSFCRAQFVGCSLFCRLIVANPVHRIQPEPFKSVTRLPFGGGLIGQSRVTR